MTPDAVLPGHQQNSAERDQQGLTVRSWSGACRSPFAHNPEEVLPNPRSFISQCTVNAPPPADVLVGARFRNPLMRLLTWNYDAAIAVYVQWHIEMTDVADLKE